MTHFFNTLHNLIVIVIVIRYYYLETPGIISDNIYLQGIKFKTVSDTTI